MRVSIESHAPVISLLGHGRQPEAAGLQAAGAGRSYGAGEGRGGSPASHSWQLLGLLVALTPLPPSAPCPSLNQHAPRAMFFVLFPASPLKKKKKKVETQTLAYQYLGLT